MIIFPHGPISATFLGIAADPSDPAFFIVRFRTTDDQDELLLRIPRVEAGRLMQAGMSMVPVVGTAE